MNELLPLMTYCLLMSGTPGPNNMMLAERARGPLSGSGLEAAASATARRR